MSKITITIKDESKKKLILKELQKFAFIEIDPVDKKTTGTGEPLEKLFGIWKDRDVIARELREKTWTRNS